MQHFLTRPNSLSLTSVENRRDRRIESIQNLSTEQFETALCSKTLFSAVLNE
ncbi:hypothetical protein HSB1_32700 [Halogranum salarium B-1]|uniref:Uncharacterized protein n=1 Tax=Halogranum salarium B-1 TaxID=1210908 RepID=J2ZXV7_9EURY|nr:hypothetical protein HSB1_32700 [Halogranum salarium B-1]